MRPVSFLVLSSKTHSHSHFHKSKPHGHLAQPKKMRDNRHEKTHPQALLTKSSHRHAHTNRRASQLFYYSKSLWDVCLAAWSDAKKFAKWQISRCETCKYCTISHSHLHTFIQHDDNLKNDYFRLYLYV